MRRRCRRTLVRKASRKDEEERVTAERYISSRVNAYRSVILVTRALLAAWKLSQIAENVQLMVGHLDILFEEDPSDALVARRRRQRAQIRPVAVIV